ncbi:hypothetical protein Pcinc_012909 [Petrolisthes cinctipes]|uniref:Uncharacterized protein n=1 Tax=Petrolisthes cinctipes TaxID=88211 RepID=A0AAE1G085_PETCI|nr:hypothetical protein Pcinc_012909 [Petrolisthes cinctipes]
MGTAGGVTVVMVAVLLLVTTPPLASAQLFQPIKLPPGFDMSACGGEWSVAGCQVRLAQCSPITRALSGPAGPVTSVLACLALTSLPANPTPDFFMSIGAAFLEGKPETLVDQVGPSPTYLDLRRCVLNSTGLVGDNMALNRTVVKERLASEIPSQGLADAVVAALPSCPDPVDYSLAPLIACLRAACMSYLDPPFSPARPPAVPNLQYLGAP